MSSENSSESNKLKRIDFDSKKVIGKSGIVYRIEAEHCSVGRFQQYEEKAVSLGFGTSFKGIFETIAEIYKVATNGAPGNGDSNIAALHKIAELAYGQMTGIKDRTSTKDEFLFCTLFINADDEDRSTWNLDLAEKKVEDWVEYDSRDFFLCSLSGIEGYSAALAHTENLRSVSPGRTKSSGS